MAADQIVNRVRSATTNVYGRTLNSARNHHYLIDGTREPKEEITPVEVFLSAVSSCAVQWLEQFAREDGVKLQSLEAEIEGSRSSDTPERFDHVDIVIKAVGPTMAQARDFVERFKQRCPLYRTLAGATEVRFQVLSKPG